MEDRKRIILAENNKAFSALDENGRTVIQIKEGLSKNTYLTGKEAYELFIESIKAYQMHEYGRLLK